MKRAAIAAEVMDSLVTLIREHIARDREIKQRQRERVQSLGGPGQRRLLAHRVIGELVEAAECLHYLVSKGCKALAVIAKESPEALRPIARKEVDWPVMMSRHPGFSGDYKTVLKDLEQGEDAEVDINETSRYGTQKKSRAKGTREVARQLLTSVQIEWEHDGGRLEGEAVPRFSDDKDCLSRWWAVARRRLLEAYPEPQEILELDRLVTAPSRRRFPAHKRADILKKIEAAFKALAPLSSEVGTP
jgi:hypothetical protein